MALLSKRLIKVEFLTPLPWVPECPQGVESGLRRKAGMIFRIGHSISSLSDRPPPSAALTPPLGKPGEGLERT